MKTVKKVSVKDRPRDKADIQNELAVASEQLTEAKSKLESLDSKRSNVSLLLKGYTKQVAQTREELAPEITRSYLIMMEAKSRREIFLDHCLSETMLSNNIIVEVYKEAASVAHAEFVFHSNRYLDLQEEVRATEIKQRNCSELLKTYDAQRRTLLDEVNRHTERCQRLQFKLEHESPRRQSPHSK